MSRVSFLLLAPFVLIYRVSVTHICNSNDNPTNPRSTTAVPPSVARVGLGESGAGPVGKKNK